MNCLDAETVAAWMDGGLTGAALENARLHVADCARCQALVGALGRTRAAVPEEEARRASKRWLAWAVPLTAAAAAVILWVAVPGQQNASLVAPPAAVPATSPSQTPASPSSEPPAVSPSPERPAAAAPSAPAAPGNLQAREEKDAPLQPEESARADADIRERREVAAGAAAAPAAPAASANVLAQKAAAPSLCGAQWVAPAPPTGADLVAGSAPSNSLCWVVGRAGIILRSTDRQSWQRVQFVEMTDLSGVRATDARTATVSTIDGRTFATTDGGQTWRQQ